jgi:hypothetical protein
VDQIASLAGSSSHDLLLRPVMNISGNSAPRKSFHHNVKATLNGGHKKIVFISALLGL